MERASSRPTEARKSTKATKRKKIGPEAPVLFPFSPERFAVPLAFKPARSGGIGHLHPDLAQRYVLEPLALDQKRFRGRAALTPDLDLSRFRVDAVVDWVGIGVEIASDQSAVNVREWVETATGKSMFIAGPNGEEGQFGREFAVEIHDPTPERLTDLMAAIDAHPRLRCNGRVTAIEVSIDWYPYSREERDRLLMADLLWRHLLPRNGAWRVKNGAPRNFIGVGGGDQARAKDTRPLLARPTAAVRSNAISYAGVELKPDAELSRDLAWRCHLQPAVDGTIYFGPKLGEVQIKVMHKIMDEQNRQAGTQRNLGKRKRRARIEVTLRGAQLKKLGITTVKELRRFEFRKLAAPYFSFWLPTVPFHRGKASAVTEVATGVRSRQEIDTFCRTGVFGLEVDQRARRKLVVRAQGELKKVRGTRRKLQRAGKGPNGCRIAFSVLEARTYDALRRLSREWAVGT